MEVIQNVCTYYKLAQICQHADKQNTFIICNNPKFCLLGEVVSKHSMGKSLSDREKEILKSIKEVGVQFFRKRD